MLRCPTCGQSFWAIFMSREGQINITVSLDAATIDVDREFDPVELNDSAVLTCPRCKKADTHANWVKCWNDPLFFLELEKEEMCRCGGEIVFQVSLQSALAGRNSNNPSKTTSPFACEVCGLPPGRNPLRYPTLEEIPYEGEDEDVQKPGSA